MRWGLVKTVQQRLIGAGLTRPSRGIRFPAYLAPSKRVEALESRLLRCGGGDDDGLDDGSPAFRFFCGPLPVYTAPALSVGVGAAAASSGPLSSLPLLHSRP